MSADERKISDPSTWNAIPETIESAMMKAADLARENATLRSRLLSALDQRHKAHEGAWGVWVRECRHPSCSLDVKALATFYDELDKALDEAEAEARRVLANGEK